MPSPAVPRSAATAFLLYNALVILMRFVLSLFAIYEANSRGASVPMDLTAPWNLIYNIGRKFLI